MKYALLAIAALMTLGCVDWVRVKPTALTAYNHAATAESPDKGLQIKTLIRMRTVSNRMVEVNADDNIRITLADGTVHELYPPLEVIFEYGQLVIRSRYASPQTYSPEQIHFVEVQASGF